MVNDHGQVGDLKATTAADVLVVQAADHGHGDDVSVVIGHDRAVVRGVLAQRQVGACGMIVRNVLSQNAMQLSLAEDDDVVETLPADGSDHAFAVRILPGKGVDDLLCGPARGLRRWSGESGAIRISFQDGQLLPQGHVFQHEFALRFEARSCSGEEAENQVQHARTGA